MKIQYVPGIMQLAADKQTDFFIYLDIYAALSLLGVFEDSFAKDLRVRFVIPVFILIKHVSPPRTA